jgi:hypothetical protein
MHVFLRMCISKTVLSAAILYLPRSSGMAMRSAMEAHLSMVLVVRQTSVLMVARRVFHSVSLATLEL